MTLYSGRQSKIKHESHLEVIDLENYKPKKWCLCTAVQPKKPWVNNGLVKLSTAERVIIKSPAGWLSDEIIDAAAQNTLHEQFGVPGLQSAVCGQSCNFQVESGEFVQVLHNGKTTGWPSALSVQTPRSFCLRQHELHCTRLSPAVDWGTSEDRGGSQLFEVLESSHADKWQQLWCVCHSLCNCHLFRGIPWKAVVWCEYDATPPHQVSPRQLIHHVSCEENMQEGCCGGGASQFTASVVCLTWMALRWLNAVIEKNGPTLTVCLQVRQH